MLALQRSAGNTAVVSLLALQRSAGNTAGVSLLARQGDAAAAAHEPAGGAGDVWAGVVGFGETVAMAVGLQQLGVEHSVGRGGRNLPFDIARVRVALQGAGYPAAEGPDGLASAIEHYQAEVVGLRRPDGRIDPGGRTIRALGAAPGASAAGTGAGASTAPLGPASPETTPATVPKSTPATAPDATSATTAAPAHAPVTATGPRGLLADATLEQLVAAAHNPEIDAAAAELAALESKFKALSRSSKHEEEGEGRDELVEGFRSLRAKVAAFDKAGLDAKTTAALKAHFNRAMNEISPFYYQGVNIILEFDRVNKTTGKLEHVWNTCNITSTAMALEALGRSAADYKHKDLIPPIAQVFKKDVDERATGRVFQKDAEGKSTGKVAADMSGLRLSDYLAMAAIAWQMGYKTGTPEQILKGGNDAFNNIPSADAVKTLAKDFGADVKHRFFSLDAKAPKSGMDALKKYGAKHSKQADVQAEAKTKLSTIEEQLERTTDPKKRARFEKDKARLEGKIGKPGALSDAAIEAELPIEEYKNAVLSQLGPDLDAGRQIVVGQHNHFVRLESIDDQFVVKDDPGGFTRGNMRATWEEARAMGMFWQTISIG